MHVMNTAMTWQTLSTDSGATEKIGKALGKLLKGGEIIELRGDLGSGKTTLTRGLAKGIGACAEVASPTFVLNKTYRGTAGRVIQHFDFYRLNRPGTLVQDLHEALSTAGNIVVLEWANIVLGVLPRRRLIIELKPDRQHPAKRIVTITYPASLAGLIKNLDGKGKL